MVARPLTSLNVPKAPSKANYSTASAQSPNSNPYCSQDSYVQPIDSNVGTPTCKCVIATRILHNPLVAVECSVILETRVFCAQKATTIHTLSSHKVNIMHAMMVRRSYSPVLPQRHFEGPIIYDNYRVFEVQVCQCNPMWEMYKEMGRGVIRPFPYALEVQLDWWAWNMVAIGLAPIVME